MKGCTRCGRWHSDPEKVLGKRLSCSEIKRYWSGIKDKHKELYGHLPQITTDDSGNWICFKCKRRIQLSEE